MSLKLAKDKAQEQHVALEAPTLHRQKQNKLACKIPTLYIEMKPMNSNKEGAWLLIDADIKSIPITKGKFSVISSRRHLPCCQLTSILLSAINIYAHYIYLQEVVQLLLDLTYIIYIIT